MDASAHVGAHAHAAMRHRLAWVGPARTGSAIASAATRAWATQWPDAEHGLSQDTATWARRHHRAADAAAAQSAVGRHTGRVTDGDSDIPDAMRGTANRNARRRTRVATAPA